MEPGTWRGLFTAFMFLAFIGIVLWAWSKGRKKDFDAAAALPLEHDRFVASNGQPAAQIPEGDRKS
jgi:cytochrome c oxidase cbb3-type subunit IV